MSKVQKQPVTVVGFPAVEEGARSGGDRREPERSEPSSTAAAPASAPAPGPKDLAPPPDPEVSSDRPKRRRFDAAYKRRILELCDAARGQPGEIGALLRREGLYSSLVTDWRRQRDAGVIAALAPHKRGRKTEVADAMAERVAELEQEKARLEERLRKAEIIIDVQKKFRSS
jgi:transposase-like protein